MFFDKQLIAAYCKYIASPLTSTNTTESIQIETIIHTNTQTRRSSIKQISKKYIQQQYIDTPKLSVQEDYNRNVQNKPRV